MASNAISLIKHGFFLMENCRFSTNTLVASKSQLSSYVTVMYNLPLEQRFTTLIATEM